MALNLFGPVRPAVTPERFAAWPEHMRREFALLVADHPGGDDRAVRGATGIAAAALVRARETTGRFALSFAEHRALDEDEERIAESKRRWKAKVRDA